jgi:putative membrane protein insertion efficiency factor
VEAEHRHHRHRAPVVRRVLILPLVVYQRAVSPFLPRRCRFVPSCSEYAREAILRYGPLRGGWLALRRLVRCGPWHPGGYDPVP